MMTFEKIVESRDVSLKLRKKRKNNLFKTIFVIIGD